MRIERGGGAGFDVSRLCGVLVFVLLASSACAPERPRGLAERWIERSPTAFLSASDLLEVECLRSFDLESGELPAGLALLEGSILRGVGRGLTIRGGNSAPRLRIEGAFSAEEVDALRVTISGLRRGKLRILRRTENGPEPPDVTMLGSGSGPLHDHFVADFGDRPRLEGPVTLELEPTSVAGEVVTMDGLCVGRRSSSSARVGEALTVPWKVRAGPEVRDSLLVTPSAPVERRVESTRNRILRFGFTRLSGGPGKPRLIVEATDSSNRVTRVMEEELDVADPTAPWRDLSVDLSSIGRGPVKVRISVQAEGELVGALSNPRVVEPGATSKLPNIVIVSLDTLRADHLSLYGYGRATSPRLDAWARKSAIAFRRVVAPSGWTLPSHFSLFTGLDAHRHAANYYRGAFDASSYRFLAQILREKGYRTAAITGGGFVHPDFGLSLGFETFRFWDRGVHSDEELERNLAAAGEFLSRETGEPFLLFLHTYEIHTPNGPREPYFSQFSSISRRVVSELIQDPPTPENGFLGSLHQGYRESASGPAGALTPELESLPLDAYDSAIAFTDSRVTPLLERLSSPPFGDRTVIAVLSDHGETLEPRGRAGHGYISADNLMVPLLLALPGERTAEQRWVEPQVRLIDLLPTILELAGASVPEGLDGRSLLPMLENRAAPGRDAIAYGASTNFGLARLSHNGVKMEWRNSPWRPLAGEIRFSRISGSAEYSLEPDLDPVLVERWRRDLAAAYARNIPGLSVEIRNLSRAPIELELVSDLVDPVSTKSPDIAPVAIDWSDIGRIDARLGGGETMRLHFERVPRRNLGLTLGVRSEECGLVTPLSVAGAAGEFATVRNWVVAADDCGARRSIPVAEVRARWQGPLPSSAMGANDERLEADLKALGYLQ